MVGRPGLERIGTASVVLRNMREVHRLRTIDCPGTRKEERYGPAARRDGKRRLLSCHDRVDHLRGMLFVQGGASRRCGVDNRVIRSAGGRTSYVSANERDARGMRDRWRPARESVRIARQDVDTDGSPETRIRVNDRGQKPGTDEPRATRDVQPGVAEKRNVGFGVPDDVVQVGDQGNHRLDSCATAASTIARAMKSSSASPSPGKVPTQKTSFMIVSAFGSSPTRR